jgi:hypothetical protein
MIDFSIQPPEVRRPGGRDFALFAAQRVVHDTSHCIEVKTATFSSFKETGLVIGHSSPRQTGSPPTATAGVRSGTAG